ncbi:hypothetical protein GZ78_14430 [Endozoicomonas numazuensis]|uniref:Uncharacterized protein n=1 Tax=Endozoicomonas numazuensis TaxID=1137799 RepID=A0A081NF59_9GAMM|nr:hypothetical protein GZ78_14430 [Endozoicomonas numazuensis]
MVSFFLRVFLAWCCWQIQRKYLLQGATIEIQQLSTLASLLFLSSELFSGSEPSAEKAATVCSVQ